MIRSIGNKGTMNKKVQRLIGKTYSNNHILYRLEDYETLKPIIDEFKIDKSSAIVLNIGCGNSEFSERMYDDGYHNNYNIDICENVIKDMVDRNKHREKIVCI